MDAAQRQLNDQIDDATQRLLDTARVIAEPDLRQPSLLPDWTRAHVLGHVARSADAMRNLLIGARSGEDRPAYPSAEARVAGIEESAALEAKDLMADLAGSAMAFRAIARQLTEEDWQYRVRSRWTPSARTASPGPTPSGPRAWPRTRPRRAALAGARSRRNAEDPVRGGVGLAAEILAQHGAKRGFRGGRPQEQRHRRPEFLRVQSAEYLVRVTAV